MSSGAEFRWRERWAEGLTIVISILLALFADAAWDYRGDRVEEEQLLEGLRTEFVEAADEIANDIAARDQILARTDHLLAARGSADGGPAPDSLQDVVRDLVNWRFYTPVHAVLDDAVESGRLDLIQSREVREAIVAYLQARERLPVFERLERDFVTNELEPYLAPRLALDQVMAEEPDRAALIGQADRLTDLLADDRFGSLLFIRRDRSEQAQIYSRIVERAIRDVRAAVGALQ
jgi:hypothetical protein